MTRPNLTIPVKPTELELKLGCEDRAVEGGYAAMIRTWAEDQIPRADPDLARRLERLAAAVVEYGRMPVPQRREVCEKVLRALELYRKRYRSGQPPDKLTADHGLGFLRGVGPRRAQTLRNLGLHTVGDLLRHYPVRYDDRRVLPLAASLEHRQSATLIVTVTELGHVVGRRGRAMAQVPATDGATDLTLVWYNQQYRAQQFEPGTVLVVSGQATLYRGQLRFIVAQTEMLSRGGEAQEEEGETQEQTPQDSDEQRLSVGRIVPMYRLTRGVSQGWLRGLVAEALEACDPLPEGVVPASLAEARGLMPLPEALRQVHFPTDDTLRKAAHARIAYEELFELQVVLARRKTSLTQDSGSASLPGHALMAEFIAALPFAPTGAQLRVLAEIAGDLERPTAANRLIHGDVGSGKTVVAAFALMSAARAGKQGALMAPTELLAEQHYKTLREPLQRLGIPCRLLTGSMTEDSKRRLREHLEVTGGEVVVGTHALFQEAVRFRDLAVAVVDEQHRFGVRQRAELSGKGDGCKVFVMSATPIPRTLALTAYGDFDVSVLDELPPNRKPVLTVLAWGKERLQAYETVAARVAAGQQAYLVCPLVEDGGSNDVAAAEREFHRLQEGHFAGLRLGLLHGRKDSAEREETMRKFREGELDILVATTVIEVGVDVPNATVMLVENAERFGLAQLHQLRGRIGRGTEESICILLTRASAPDVVDRLRVLERTTDGFEVAEEDLRRRGPGELAGTRQSGLPDLRMADLIADTPTLVQAREDAFTLLEANPSLSGDDTRALREALERLEQEETDWAI
ncbi:ATP-dependent DNA helicase RecG [bacterium]|nr:ATP-dependent DNA helicase RecG [bacterium]